MLGIILNISLYVLVYINFSGVQLFVYLWIGLPTTDWHNRKMSPKNEVQ